LIISERPAFKEALSLQDHDVQQGRLRRLKRASDLSYKGKNLTDYAPNMKFDPFKVEFYPDVIKVQKRDEEYDLLELHKK
jgi:ubiquinol-cytochrome c reductase subunit 7